MKEQIEARKKEIAEQFKKIQAAIVNGEQQLFRLQGAFAELENMASMLPPPPDSEKSE